MDTVKEMGVNYIMPFHVSNANDRLPLRAPPSRRCRRCSLVVPSKVWWVGWFLVFEKCRKIQGVIHISSNFNGLGMSLMKLMHGLHGRFQRSNFGWLHPNGLSGSGSGSAYIPSFNGGIPPQFLAVNSIFWRYKPWNQWKEKGHHVKPMHLCSSKSPAGAFFLLRRQPNAFVLESSILDYFAFTDRAVAFKALSSLGLRHLMRLGLGMIQWLGWTSKAIHFFQSIITGWWWLEHESYFSTKNWEFHHPNWRTHIFQRGRAQPPTISIDYP